MFKSILSPKRIPFLIVGLFALFVVLSPATKADDLNSKSDLCAGANLSVEGQGAGCNKVYDSATNTYKEAADDQKPVSKFNTIATDVLNLISIIAGMVTVFMVIYGGFRFLTSAGNPESTKAGKNAILYAFIGLLIVAFAQIIVKYILTKIS